MGNENVGSFVTSSLLGIDPNERYAHQPEHLEKRAREILDPIDIYLEDEPSVLEWFKELVPSARGTKQYVRGLFPPVAWLKRYNVQWLLGDMVAGSEWLYSYDGLMMANSHRNHYWSGCCTSGYGICVARTAEAGIRIIYFLYGRSTILDVWNF